MIHLRSLSAGQKIRVVEELRRLLPRLENSWQGTALPLGLAAIDSHLPQGGLTCGGLHEIVPANGSIPAAFGFIVALLGLISSPPWSNANILEQYQSDRSRKHPTSGAERLGAGQRLYVISPAPVPSTSLDAGARQRGGPGEGGKIVVVLPGYGRYDRLFGHGLNALGLDPGRLILVETAQRRDTLWAMEEALRSRAPAAVAGAIDRLDLKSSQRLQLAATDAGLPLFLLRPAGPAASSSSLASGRGWEGGSAAATRWRIGTAAAARDRYGLIVRPRWHLQLERCRNGRPGEWIVEYDHVAHCFSLAAALADRSLSRDAESARCGRAGRS